MENKKKKILLIVHNLPYNMSVRSIKRFIKDNCGAKAVGLKNLTIEGQVKRITVRLFEETEAALLVKNINGMYLGEHQLFVEDAPKKSKSSVNLDMKTAVNPPTTSYSNNSTFNKFNPNTCIQSSTDFDAPPSKMPRFCNSNVDKFGNNHPATTVTNDDMKIPLEPQSDRHTNLFDRAAGIIAADTMKNGKVRFLTNYYVVYQHLKKFIGPRIDVIMENKVPNTLDEIIKCYRLKFARVDDPQFVKDVLEKIERGTAEPEHPNQGDTRVSDDDFQNMSCVTANENPGVSANQQTQDFEIDNYAAGQISNTIKPNEMPKPSGMEKPNSPANVAV